MRDSTRGVPVKGRSVTSLNGGEAGARGEDLASEAGKLTPSDLAVSGVLALHSPAEVSNPTDNLKNLFEIPVLFYALALYVFTVGQVDATHFWSAWVFVLFRALHSAVHCTINIVMLRFNLYLVSALAVWLMLVRAVLAYVGS